MLAVNSSKKIIAKDGIECVKIHLFCHNLIVRPVGVSEIYASMVWRPAFNVHSFTAAIKSHDTASSA